MVTWEKDDIRDRTIQKDNDMGGLYKKRTKKKN